MVSNKLGCLLFCFLFLPWLLTAEAAVIEASIEPDSSFEGQAIEGTITITRNQGEIIDPASFIIDGEALKAALIQEAEMPSDAQKTIVSIYRFTLPAKEKGLYVLPSISVRVGSQVHQSVPSAYEVRSPKAASAPAASIPQQPANSQKEPAKKVSSRVKPTSQKPASSLIFRLEAKINGPSTLYPGQRTQLFYRISYNRSVDLTESALPFIYADSLKKIGDARISDYQQGEVTVQEIVQEVEASQPGSFTFGPSKIAGYAYQVNMFGNKVYQPGLLLAEAPAIQLEVKPFPLENQPASFNGALGKIEAAIEMRTPPERRLGDKIELVLSVGGIDNLEELRLPNFHCQPGFSGFFQFSDLPPTGEIKEGSKHFRIELIPISAFVQAVPSLELASFDPQAKRYLTQKTSPIALQIKSVPFPDQPPAALTRSSESLNEKLLWNPKAWPLAPLEIKGAPVPPQSLFLPWFKTPWVLFIIPFGIGWLLLMLRLHRKWAQRPRPLKKQSEALLAQALKAKRIPAHQVLHLLEKAYWWKAWEEGLLPSKQTNLEQLPKQGPMGKVHAFILYLQTLQYSPQSFSLPDVLSQAKILFHELNQNKEAI